MPVEYNALAVTHVRLVPRTYFEVGVRHGQSMSLALPGTKCVGVDPDYTIRFSIPRSARLYRMTSDEFFRRKDLRDILQVPIDLSLIDGLHLSEAAIRDFQSTERLSAVGSVIVIDDCYPDDIRTAGRTPHPDTIQWAGDVWRVLLALSRYRPDLRIQCLVGPGTTGLAFVTNLDPNSDVNLEEGLKEFQDLPFDDSVLTSAIQMRRSMREVELPGPFRSSRFSTLSAARVLRPPRTRAALKGGVYRKLERTHIGRTVLRQQAVIRESARTT